MKGRLELCLGRGLLALAVLALAAGCDKPFDPAGDPHSPVPAQPLPAKTATPYLGHDELADVYDYLVTAFKEARNRHFKISQQKKAGDQDWRLGWSQWMTFAENQGRIIEVRRENYKQPRYQAGPGSPVPCFSDALIMLDGLINIYGRNLGQDFPLGPEAEANFQTKLAQCKQLLDNYEPPEEFSGTPPPKIK